MINSENKIFKNSKSPLSFAHYQIRELKKKYKKNDLIWKLISIIIAILNLAILGFSLYLLSATLITYNNSGNKNGWFANVGPSVFVILATILLFPLTFFVTIYHSLMRANYYKKGYISIQHILMKYYQKIDQFKNNNRDEIFKKEVDKIILESTNKKFGEISFKKALKKTIVGDSVGK